jgi:hypothetical protein
VADDVGREIGALEARLDSQEKRLDRIDTNVEKLLEYAARTKGGWWALATVGTVGGAAGAAIAKMLAMLKGGG